MQRRPNRDRKLAKARGRPNISATAIAEERYRALIRATSSLVWITPPDGEIRPDQPEWRAYTGTSVEQIKGWGWLETLHPDDRERARIDWQRAVDKKLHTNLNRPMPMIEIKDTKGSPLGYYDMRKGDYVKWW